MAKTQTKTEIRNASSKLDKLLRGIDNNTEIARKEQKKLDARFEQISKDTQTVKTLISSITNTAMTAVSTPAPAPAKTASKPEKAAKASKPAKPQKQDKAKPAVKTAAKPQKGQGSAKKPAGKANAKERRPLKDVVNEILAKKGPALPADLYKEVTKSEGYYSRQSLYMALKSDDYKKLSDGRYDRASTKSSTKPSTDEADAFVSQVESNEAVANVV